MSFSKCTYLEGTREKYIMYQLACYSSEHRDCAPHRITIIENYHYLSTQDLWLNARLTYKHWIASFYTTSCKLLMPCKTKLTFVWTTIFHQTFVLDFILDTANMDKYAKASVYSIISINKHQGRI